MNTVAIVGVGLIGGSFALALRKAGFEGKIIGVSSPATIAKAVERGVIDAAGSVADADLLYLSQPISQILETLNALDTDALITDAGSTKAVICERAKKLKRGRFIGGHPMAGKESRGVEHADADLFRARPYVLTARDAELEKWIERIGARLVILDPQEHDRLVALVSHLPQLLSTALAAAIGEDVGAAKLAGPAALDLTRLALSPYEIWRDIFSTNAVPLDAALGAFIARLEELRTQLRTPEMERAFAAASSSARALRTRLD
ncbi:MAG: prephenate dehydrogenase [Bryobacteraceae bacterium]